MHEEASCGLVMTGVGGGRSVLCMHVETACCLVSPPAAGTGEDPGLGQAGGWF